MTMALMVCPLRALKFGEGLEISPFALPRIPKLKFRRVLCERGRRYFQPMTCQCYALFGYPLKAGQLTYDCRYSTMHGMPVTGGRGFRGLKPLWYNSVPP